jgi:hypothetical protein
MSRDNPLLILGSIRHLPRDSQGHERRERLEAIVGCPKCGETVRLWSETEAWTQGDKVDRETGERPWNHSEYGPAMGVCETCHVLIVDDFNGCRWFQLED